MADIPLSSIVGGLGFKVESSGNQLFSLSGITNQNVISIPNPSNKVIRLTALFQASSSGTMSNISVTFGLRTVVPATSIQPAFSTSSGFGYSVGGSANSAARYLEGKVGEALSVYKGATDQNVFLAVAYEIGVYE